MSTSLTKLLDEQHIDQLNDQGITITPPLCRKTLLIRGEPVQVAVSYRKPSKSLKSKNKFISDLLSKFDDVEQKYLESIDYFITQYPLLDERYILDVFKSWIVKNNPIEQTIYSIETDLLQTSIAKEFELLDEVNDYPDVFPLARKKKRKITAYLGDTNSGKTWTAMSKIADSFSSAYMAPLRLLAHETYEYLNEQGIPTSLITGEEKVVVPNSQCTSSTVECFDPMIEHDVVVIDEIQMMDDDSRGAFFIQALVGANANEVVLTGPSEYEHKIRMIAEYLGEEVEVHHFKRKSNLKPLRKPTNLKDIKSKTAIVAFSKKDVYAIQRMLPKHIKSTVLYGALGYDVRKTQAERFRNGEVDVIITTDCIGMGLNLPIETILFSATQKYDGESVKNLTVMLAKQIAGRAGRFGQYDTGYFGALNKNDLGFIKQTVNKKLKAKKGLLSVIPPKRYITSLLNQYPLSDILRAWQDSHKFVDESIFIAGGLDRQIEIAEYLERYYPNDYLKFWNLIYCPIDFDKQYLEFHEACKQLIGDRQITIPDPNVKVTGQNGLELLLKEINMYLWLENTFTDYFENGDRERLMDIMHDINKELNVILGKNK